MVKSHLDMEETVVVLAKDAKEEIMGLTVFVMESLNGAESAADDALHTIDTCLPKKLSNIFTFLDFMKSNVDMKGYKVDTWADVE